ncbi:uncharacterized protein [Macrobrachium rosenbergii]|uniref:uncharacterized protein n=1 Tax=Macrobrachium rosenbergii TaxID=79674 RepID=UPI0034D6CD15
MSTRRQLSWRARQGSQRLKEGSRRAAVNCWGDFTNPRLVPIKVVFFIIMGATQCIAPFTTPLMRALGLNLQEVGLIFTIGPLIPVFAPLLAGLIADKLGNFRGVLVFTVAMSGLVALINVTIPPARTNPTYSDTLTLGLTCEGEDFILTPPKPKKEEDRCVFYNRTLTAPMIEAENCGYICPEPVAEYPPLMFKKVKKAKIVTTVNSTLYHLCDIQDGKKNSRFVQKCFRVNLNKSMAHEDLPKNFSLHNVEMRLEEVAHKKPHFVLISAPMDAKYGQKLHCVTGEVPKKIFVPKLVISEQSFNAEEGGKLVKCIFHCSVEIPHNLTCQNRPLSIEHDVALSFWLFVSVKLVMKFLIGLSYTLFEVAVVAILKEFGHDYGLQRIYGSVGGMVFAPLSGFFIDLFGDGEHYTDYYVIFIFYCALKILCALMLVKLDLRFKVPARSICENIGNIFTNFEVVLLILVVFISGMCYGFIENFLPWLLRDLEATNWFIGILTTIASVSAIPFLALSGGICKKFGNIQSIAFGLVCYSIRCIGYSMLKEYYWCMPFEVLEGVTTGLLVAAAITYGAQLSSKSNVATLQGILATFHYGLGKSAGSLLGGYLMTWLGAPFSFQIFSGIAFTTGFAYYLIGKLVILPRHAKRLKRKREIMAMPVETISKEEHKRMTQLAYSPPFTKGTLYNKKERKREASPNKSMESAQIHSMENDVMDETQMTELPADDTVVSLNSECAESERKDSKE